MSLDPITAGLSVLDTFIGKFVKDKDLAQKLQAEARSETFSGDLSLLMGQIEINKIEAQSKSLFKGGWRPYIGWICGTALLYNTILHPIFDIWFVMPTIDSSLLYPVLMGLLGLGGMRTYERVSGAIAKD